MSKRTRARRTGAVGNATWAGTPLAPILQEAGILDRGIEVVFFGSDTGVEDVRDIKMPQHMARSMALADALDPQILLCYEMNGEPLPQSHGFPLRLIAPGWYGIANTKWLQSIQVLPTRYENRFMARDYVTIREQQRDGQSVWTETSVGRALLKSAPAKVTRTGGQYRIIGAAWGAPIARVEVQIDGGAWLPASTNRLSKISTLTGTNTPMMVKTRSVRALLMSFFMQAQMTRKV